MVCPFYPFSRVRFPHSSLSLSLIPSFRVFLPPSPPPRLTLRGSLSLSCDISLSFSRSFAHSQHPPPFIFYLFWVLSRSLAFSLTQVHSLSPGSGSSFLSHSYLSGLTVSLTSVRALSLSGLPFLWVRFPHSVTQSFFTQSSLLNLTILISQVSLSLTVGPRVPHSRSFNLELPELFVRLLTRSCSCSRSLPHARARSLSLDLELLSRSPALSLSLISPVLLLSLTLAHALPLCLARASALSNSISNSYLSLALALADSQ